MKLKMLSQDFIVELETTMSQPGAGTGQRGRDAGCACWHAAALGGWFCRGVAARGRQVISVVARVVLARRDEAPLFGEWRGHRRRSGSRPGHPPRSPPSVPPQGRLAGTPTSRRSVTWEDQEKVETERSRPRRQSLGRPRRLCPQRGHHCGVAS